jgi:hypothetical protein
VGISREGFAKFENVIPGKYAVDLIIQDRADVTIMRQRRVTNLIEGDNMIELLPGPNQVEMTFKGK